MSSSDVAKLLPTANAVIQRWVARYEELGIDGLSMKSQTYSGDFKVQVVEYIHENVITELRHKYKLSDLLQLAGIPRSTYYYHFKRMNSTDKYKT